MLSPFRRLCCAAMLFASGAALRALTVDPGDGTVPEGFSPCPAIVEGRPAIAYTDYQNTAVKYVRATDASGTAWGAPVIVDKLAGRRIFLRTVNGLPAVCYYSSYNIKYASATDTTGETWGAPATLEPAIHATDIYAMEIVDGNPAVCYMGGDLEHLMFMRALDARGTAWGEAMRVGDDEGITEIRLKIVEGHPVIIYTHDRHLWYRRAADAAGSVWGPRMQVSEERNGSYQHVPSMQIVNGRPAICYYEDRRNDLKYVRATDATGTAWNPPVTLDGAQSVIHFCSLAVVQGKPAVGYFASSPNDDLKYVPALDSDGDTAAAWGPPVTVDSTGYTGWFPSLLEVNGSPALVYHDFTAGSLKYIRATDASAGTRWPAEVYVDTLVQEDDGSPLPVHVPRGAVHDYGQVQAGSTQTFTATVRNPNSGSVPLTNVEVIVDGPDAAEFPLSQAPADAIEGGGSTSFSVSYAPVKTGSKTASLHIITRAEGVRDSYNISLVAATLPEIILERSNGSPLSEGQSMWLPLAVAGAATDLAFTVRNTGVAELNISAITFDGPDAAEFSVTTSPATAVAPGKSTSFTVHHLAAAAGRKTAVMHIASNAAGSKNPFDVTLAMGPGQLDPAFHTDEDLSWGFAVQPDGKIVAGAKVGMVRFLPAGGLDTAFFSPPLNPGGFAQCLALQKDGKILIGGNFTRAGGQARTALARVLPDGSLDEAFAPPISSGSVACLAVQPDGKILAGGFFDTSGGVRWLARFHPDGSLDSPFFPTADGYVRCIALQPDGKILAGGNFENMQSTSSPHIARLHTDGTLDAAFSAGFSDDVYCLAVQSDDRIVAGGGFPSGIARLFPDGTRDESMSAIPSGVNDLVLQADGGCVAVGTGGDSPGPFLFSPDGSLDAAFHSDTNATSLRLALQADGKVLSMTWGGHLARLDNDPASTLLKTEGRSTVRWLRSGSAAEVRDVTFDVKPDNSPGWTPLGSAHRIPGGWELSGLALPSAGQIRAQGYAGGSVMESVSSILTAIESWRLQYFNTPNNSGAAADDADPDHDGLTNFIEYAFGLNPVDRTGSALPEFKYANGSFTATFTAPAGREGVVYSAESSPLMLPGTWTQIPDTGNAGTHTFSVPAGGERIFVRYVARR